MAASDSRLLKANRELVYLYRPVMHFCLQFTFDCNSSSREAFLLRNTGMTDGGLPTAKYRFFLATSSSPFIISFSLEATCVVYKLQQYLGRENRMQKPRPFWDS
jgi:hypothetical protein